MQDKGVQMGDGDAQWEVEFVEEKMLRCTKVKWRSQKWWCVWWLWFGWVVVVRTMAALYSLGLTRGLESFKG